jgi:hypothetical protein
MSWLGAVIRIGRELTWKPLGPGVMKVPPSLKPSAIAPSIAPEIAWPDPCATSLVTLSCSARSLALSAGMFTVCAKAGEVLRPKLPLPP